MIVQCPQCQSKSRVDDAGAARGARVRCASCSHVFLPIPAAVPAKASVQRASQSGFGDEDFSGKTSMFTGVIPKEAVGLTSPPPAAPVAPRAMDAAPTVVDAPPKRVPTAAPAAEDFGANRTQAIDVSQLAAYSAKLPAAAPSAVHGLGAPPPSSKATSTAAASPLAAVLEAEPQTASVEDTSTAVIGTHKPGLLSAGVTLTSKFIGGLSAVAGLCGVIFFMAGNGVYAAAGLMGGASIDIQGAQSDSLVVEQVTSTLYSLADGQEALVAVGTVGNVSDAEAPRMEVEFTLTDKDGVVQARARGPIGAVLSLEELATITLPNSAAAELRRRVANLPPLGPHSHDRKFMAVILRNPKDALPALSQALSLMPALAVEAAPAKDTAAQAANVGLQVPDDEPVLDPELPASALPPATAVSDLPLPASLPPVKTSAPLPAAPSGPAPSQVRNPPAPVSDSATKSRKKDSAAKPRKRR